MMTTQSFVEFPLDVPGTIAPGHDAMIGRQHELAPATGLTKTALSVDGISPLWRKHELDGPQSAILPAWAQSGLASFRQVIMSQGFPCFFAPSSERKGRLLYAFSDSVDKDADIAHVEKAFTAYLESLEDLPQAEADMTVLIVLIKPSGVVRTLNDYAEDTKTLLSALHHRDEVAWPADVPTDPDDPRWSYALSGRALFINVSTPANIARRSRNVGPCLALIVSPRDVFDRVAGPDEKGQKVRSSIRERTATYDGGLPFAPWSAVRYGEGGTGTERQQYVLSEDNEHPISMEITPKPAASCPFVAWIREKDF